MLSRLILKTLIAFPIVYAISNCLRPRARAHAANLKIHKAVAPFLFQEPANTCLNTCLKSSRKSCFNSLC